MNVSISKVVTDLHTSVTAMQAAITFYTLTMAALMLIGAKLGTIWGRKKAFVIGAIIYACGSLITGLSQNIQMLFLGWSVIEGIGAVLVIPAIAALIANNYQGQARIKAYAMIGAVSGLAVAAGPLIGGFMTTYLSWRYVFFGEVVIMAIILLFRNQLKDSTKPIKQKIDLTSALESSFGLVFIVFALLQSKTWGWITPRQAPVLFGHEITPLGISLVPYLILLGIILLKLFFDRQNKLIAQKKPALLDPSLLSIKRLRSGLSVLMAQYAITAAIFFVIPVYLQMTLGYDALKTGIKIFPLSFSLIIFSLVGTRLSSTWSPKKIVRFGQLLLILGSGVLLASINIDLRGWLFGTAIFIVGAALGLLASQLGNVNMSSVKEEKSSEVGGLQGVFQNLGSSLGVALIGSVMISSLSTNFNDSIQASALPSTTKNTVSEQSQKGIAIVPISEVNSIATQNGLTPSETQTATQIYSDSQISALKESLYALLFISIVTLFFSKNIPDEIVK